MAPEISEIFPLADKYEKEYIALWRDICLLESPTKDKAGVDAAVAFLCNKARDIGFDVTVADEPISGSPACIIMNKDAEGTPIALSGHMDTVHEVGVFGTPTVKLDGENIYGPGVCDCKGGVAAAFYAMNVLSAAGFKARPIKLILQTDEETSSVGSNKRTVDFMYECAKDCRAFINLEGYNIGKVTVGRKGILKYKAKVTGFPMHSALCYEGVSAIREAAHKIIELEKLQERKGITFNCGVISGGTTSNTVAGECEFTVDIRFPNAEAREDAEQILNRVINTSYLEGTSSRLIKQSERCAMEITDKNSELAEALNSAYERAGLPRLEARIRAGGSDAADMTARGLACVDSLGVHGGYIHTTREYAVLSSLKESARRIIAAALYLD